MAPDWLETEAQRHDLMARTYSKTVTKVEPTGALVLT